MEEATDDDLRGFFNWNFFQKIHGFRRDRLVAQDRENLMFCASLDCESVLDKRLAGNRRQLPCDWCKRSTCKLCRQEYHGE